jgi:hypothetical protein
VPAQLHKCRQRRHHDRRDNNAEKDIFLAHLHVASL